MEILRKYKRRKHENSAGKVYFHWFCTSVFPTSNLMSSQRPIFNWLTDQTIKLLSISVSILCFFFYFPPTEVATCSPRLPIFSFLVQLFEFERRSSCSAPSLNFTSFCMISSALKFPSTLSLLTANCLSYRGLSLCSSNTICLESITSSLSCICLFKSFHSCNVKAIPCFEGDHFPS